MKKEMKFNNMSLNKYSEMSGNKVYTPTSSYQKIRKKEFDKRRWMNVLSSDGIMQ